MFCKTYLPDIPICVRRERRLETDKAKIPHFMGEFSGDVYALNFVLLKSRIKIELFCIHIIVKTFVYALRNWTIQLQINSSFQRVFSIHSN